MKRISLSLIILASFTSASAAINSNGSSTAWNNTGGWSCGCVINMEKWDGSHKVNISHTKIRNGKLRISSKNVLTIKNGGHLTIDGNLEMHQQGNLVVELGGTLIVNGNIIYTGNRGSISSSGNVTINGNITIKNNGSASFLGNTNITGWLSQEGPGAFETDGTFTVGTNISIKASGVSTFGGTVTVPGNMTVWGSGGAIITGDVRVSGLLSVLNDSKVRGTGTIGWGTVNVNPVCSPARIVCSNGNQYDSNTSSLGCKDTYPNMPGNPLDLSSYAAVVTCSVPY